ncbi:MAG: ABC transporter permease [Flavobacteriaceae bacterium]|nr:ABC transporter permease [Flavobacteriaceae bacterium]
MKFIFDKDSWQEIFGSIRKSKLRTVITILGVLWGVFLFITLLGATRGMENGFDREFSSMATNSLFLWGKRTSIPNKGFKRGKEIDIKMQDVEAIKKLIPEVQFIAPRAVDGMWGAGVQVKRSTNSGEYKLFGDLPIVDEVSKVKLLEGRFINAIDVKETKKICVIGEKIVDELYEHDDKIVGSFIEIENSFFKVVGVYKENKVSSYFEKDDSIYIPFSTFRKMHNLGDRIDWMVISAHKNADIVQVEKDIKALMKRRHNVHPDDTVAFGSANLGEMLGKVMGFVKGMQFLTWFVGISTLLAGVIAIGSILLITVKERTKEIGIRRAIGATPSKIRGQIVLESVFLTSIAGALGIIFAGVALMFLDKFLSNGDFPFTNPTVNIPIALGAVAALVIFGSLIGMIPAQRAVNLRPIEALREE